MRDLSEEATAVAPQDGRAPEARASRRWWFSPVSSLTRRIVFINMIGLGLLVAGVLYLNQFRAGLIELRAQALRTQGEIIAIAVSEAAGLSGDLVDYDPIRANFVLRRLAQPAGVRARLFDRRGRLTGDTRSFSASGAPVEMRPLPPPGEAPDRTPLETLEAWYGAALDRLSGEMELYRETAIAGITTESEVYEALRGNPVTAVRANSEGELIVSVSLPVQRFKAVMGALVLSTEGGDIDAIVRAERIAILRVFMVALAVSIVLSLLLANAIARPLRRLTAAAQRSGGMRNRLINPNQVHFPDLTARADEIGYLSGALREMTEALYTRLEAIERFAADVAHEIKNPLTSLRSAVQTLRRAEAPESRERLLKVIEHDVRRMDRLVTDISNASRLDAELAREDMGPVDLGLLLHAVAEVADQSRARVEVRVFGGPVTCRGLDGRLGQVFRNLVENALSFSSRGGVVRAAARLRSDGWAVVTIDDDGPGIPEEKLEQIFERFYSDRPEDEAYGDHSGLGLAISRQIVEAHGGRIWATNRRGEEPHGARFTVELPAWTER
jgi:two-component system sensor histidine kinase ChvG